MGNRSRWRWRFDLGSHTNELKCERCGAKATHHTLDGFESKIICDAYPACGSIWAKLNRKVGWYFWTTIIPSLLISACGLYFACIMASQHKEIALLRSQLAQTQESLDRCMGPSQQ